MPVEDRKFLNVNIDPVDWQNPAWQIRNRLQGAEGITLLPFHLSEKTAFQCKLAAQKYRWAVTPYYLSLVNLHDPEDPVRKQFLPTFNEVSCSGSPESCRLSEDPLCEEKFTASKGLIHRYPDRVLVLITSMCASYCRHCNRKRTWKNPDFSLEHDDIASIIKYIKSRPEIREVILSGGDPLILAPSRLENILSLFREIRHIEVLRIGTRIPVTMPMGITSELCSMLSKYRPLWINTQFNHDSEITEESASACDRLQKAGIPVSNQTVLLKNVNDSFETLSALFRKLQSIMVRPYYLFHCEPVEGNAHFIPSLEKGIEIMNRIQERLGGLCQPKYVMDLPGGGGKAPLLPSWLIAKDKNSALFRTLEGNLSRIIMPENKPATYKRNKPCNYS